MRSVIPVAALTLALAAPVPIAAPAAAAGPPAGDNGEVRAAALAFEQAQAAGDGAALERLLAPDFLFVRGSGRIGDRRDFIAGFTAPGRRLDPPAVSDPLFLRVGADAAIVGGEARIRGSDGGKPFAWHYRFSDMLARRDGRWLVVYVQVSALPG